MPQPGFEPTISEGVSSYQVDAIGFGQGKSLWKGPNLRRQVQNFAAHGPVGF
jgi:hypothetical protein